MDRAEQRRIMQADAERRLQRDIEDWLTLHPTKDDSPSHPRHSMVVKADARAMGAVTAHTTRVNQPWSSLRTKVVGIAPGTEDTSDGTPTVRVTYADGTSEVRDVSSFRKGAERTTSKAKVTEAPELTEAQRFLPSAVEILGEYS